MFLSLNSVARGLLSCLLVVTAANVVGAQGFGPGTRVQIAEATFEPGAVSLNGGLSTLVVKLEIEPSWHIYSTKDTGVPTTFKMQTEGAVVDGAVLEPKPHVSETAGYAQTYHEGSPTFRIPVSLAAAEAGGRSIRFSVGYMACDANGCEQPTEIAGKARIEFREESAAQATPVGSTAIDAAQLRSVVEEALKGATAEVLTEIESLRNLVRPLIPDAPELPPEPPDWEIGDARISVRDGAIRAGETATLAFSFTTLEKVEIESYTDVFVDFGSSERVAEIEVIEGHSSESGTEHELILEVRAKPLARSGRESLTLTAAIPFTVDGFGFEKETERLSVDLEFGLPSIWAWVVKAAIAALLALLTPCVFPMIPVTVSFFTKQAEKDHRNPALMPAVYVVGIIVSFVVIGAGVTALSGARGVQFLATNGVVQGFFGLLFVVFSISLFGVFTLRPPAFLMAKAGAVQGRGGMVGTLGMGLLFSLTSFTCTAPLVGAILVDAAQSGEWQFPIVGMLAFSTVLAIPFFFLSLFPKVLSGLPKSGGWMNQVKVTLGFLELAFALKFIGAMDAYFHWAVFTRESILWLSAVIFILNGLYLLGVFRFAHDGKSDRVGAVPATLGVAMILFGIFLTRGAADQRRMPYLVESLMPPSLEDEEGSGDLGWANHMKDDLEGAIAKAKALGKPLLLDFTGYT